MQCFMLQFFDTVILPLMDQCNKLSVEFIYEMERNPSSVSLYKHVIISEMKFNARKYSTCMKEATPIDILITLLK